MNGTVKMRQSNFELCRIIAMIIIVFNHITSLGHTVDGITFTKNTLLSLFFLLGGKMGTNVFVILGVWFLVEKGSIISVKSIAKLWLETLFYMVVLNIVDVGGGGRNRHDNMDKILSSSIG